MTSITKQCIWITGATSGIGRAIVSHLIAQDNFVIISGRNEQALLEIMFQANGKATAFPFDLAATDQELDHYRAKLNDLTDYVDMVICCAGVCEYEDRLDFNPAMYRSIFEINVLGVVKTLNLALPLLKRSEKQPRAVLVGSMSSLVPFPRAEAYGASKAALDYMAETLIAECKSWPLSITLVRPGFVDTPMTQKNDFAMPFKVSADIAAKTILDGIAKQKTVINFPKRLYWPLRLMRQCKSLWIHVIAPKISRQNAHTWQQVD